MNLNDMGLKNKITLGSCAPIILVAIMGFVAYQSINSLLQTAGWVKHTHEVIEHAMTIEKLIVDMETGERGFLIAGKDEFLEPYNNGKAAMVKVIKETKELVSDNPKQVGRLEVIESAIAGWHQNAANPEIAERRQVVVGAEAAATFKKLQGRTVGKEIFDNLRGALATIDAKFKAAGNLAGRYLLLNTTMDLVNMETGQRGFLLTGQEGSLDPFRNGQKSLTNHLEELKKMSQGAKSNGVTAGDINKVQTLAARWVEEAASPEIDARREMNKVTTVMADVTALIEAGTGKQFMDALRVNLETFKGEELTLMLVREADAAKTAANANKTIIIGTLLTMLVAFIISFWLASKISDALKHVMAKMTRMAEGDLQQETMEIKSKDETGQLSQCFNDLLTNIKALIHHTQQILAGNTDNDQFGVKEDFDKSLQEILRQAREQKETARIKAEQDAEAALAGYTAKANILTGTMTCDENFIVTGMNVATIAILESIEDSIPGGIRVKDIIGQCIDVFHQNPAVQRNALRAIKPGTQVEVVIELGDKVLQINASCIVDDKGSGLGYLAVWQDITAARIAQNQERAAANELKEKVDSMLVVVQAAEQGDLTREITVNGDSAIGQMGAGLQKFLSSLRDDIRQIGENAQSVSAASEELTSVSATMSSNAEETAAQSGVVASASEQVGINVQTVATGAEEMSASISEIAQNANQAAKISVEAVEVTRKTNETISTLGVSSKEIGEVVKVITSIAEQTNLLALNATIEAARAGEAGKGFAVVANEVKELANQTAKATDEISGKVQSIQSDSSNAVRAIAEISEIINRINDISSTIASAVEEQSATTNEMSRNVQEAAKGVGEIAQNISGVSVKAKQTTEGTRDTSEAAGELAKLSISLGGLVAKFKI